MCLVVVLRALCDRDKVHVGLESVANPRTQPTVVPDWVLWDEPHTKQYGFSGPYQERCR